jgi:hypothetical protein
VWLTRRMWEKYIMDTFAQRSPGKFILYRSEQVSLLRPR